jgi:hypothetical protein
MKCIFNGKNISILAKVTQVSDVAHGRLVQFSGLFFYILAAIGLKLGLLLCNKELEFEFAFRCDSLIFARVTCLELRKIEEFFSFPDFFFYIFASFLQLFGLSTTDETLLVEMRIWCIKIVIVLVLHL